jgi:hypothetical protein
MAMQHTTPLHILRCKYVGPLLSALAPVPLHMPFPLPALASSVI